MVIYWATRSPNPQSKLLSPDPLLTSLNLSYYQLLGPKLQTLGVWRTKSRAVISLCLNQTLETDQPLRCGSLKNQWGQKDYLQQSQFGTQLEKGE